MTGSKEQLQNISTELISMQTALDIDKKKSRLSELELQSHDPQLWSNQDSARKIMQELGYIKDELKEFEEIANTVKSLEEIKTDEDLEIFAEELNDLEKKLKDLRKKTFLSGPYDARNALITIHAGQGGTEAMDWASMLYRMYVRYCERKSWKLSVIDISEGEEAGIKSIVVQVEGSHVYGYLKGEIGTHRLVRQSPFNADKLRQTSFASVEVLPELEASDSPDIVIKDEDLDWQFYRSGGHGGQNVNKVSTAVRLVHIPTGIVVTAQTERFQLQNRKHALDLLRSKLWLRQQELEEKERLNLKGEYKPASWGHQIRSYVLHPYKMVKDLRTDWETSDAEGVLDGDLDGFIDAELTLPTNK